MSETTGSSPSCRRTPSSRSRRAWTAMVRRRSPCRPCLRTRRGSSRARRRLRGAGGVRRSQRRPRGRLSRAAHASTDRTERARRAAAERPPRRQSQVPPGIRMTRARTDHRGGRRQLQDRRPAPARRRHGARVRPRRRLVAASTRARPGDRRRGGARRSRLGRGRAAVTRRRQSGDRRRLHGGRRSPGRGAGARRCGGSARVGRAELRRQRRLRGAVGGDGIGPWRRGHRRRGCELRRHLTIRAPSLVPGARRHHRRLGRGTRHRDGRARRGRPQRGRPGPATTLAGAVATYFGYPTALDVAVAIHQGVLSVARLIELPPSWSAPPRQAIPKRSRSCVIRDRRSPGSRLPRSINSRWRTRRSRWCSVDPCSRRADRSFSTSSPTASGPKRPRPRRACAPPVRWWARRWPASRMAGANGSAQSRLLGWRIPAADEDIA